MGPPFASAIATPFFRSRSFGSPTHWSRRTEKPSRSNRRSFSMGPKKRRISRGTWSETQQFSLVFDRLLQTQSLPWTTSLRRTRRSGRLARPGLVTHRRISTPCLVPSTHTVSCTTEQILSLATISQRHMLGFRRTRR